MSLESVSISKNPRTSKTFGFSSISFPYLTGLGLGKWDRVMTFGKKVQYDAMGIPTDFDFSEETFCQIVDNFSKCFSCRRLGLDYRHTAVNPNAEEPEQNLAYYTGLAVISNHQVIKIWDHDPNRQPPNPQELLTSLQTKFPRETSVDGLWAYKAEITPLGYEKLPNCEQLSPLFSKDDLDEFGNQIGYNLLNISAVGVAFQNGTILSLQKSKKNYSSSLAWNQKQKANKFSRKVRSMTHKMEMPQDMMAKLMRHGLSGEHADAEEIKHALSNYLTETDDSKEERKAMADACHKHLSKMSEESEHEKMSDTEEEKESEKKGLRKMGTDEEEGDEKAKEKERKEHEVMSKITHIQRQAMDKLSQQNRELKQRVEKMEKEQRDKEKLRKATEFADVAIREGRWHSDKKQDLIDVAKMDMKLAEKALMAKGTFTYMQKFTSGGKAINVVEEFNNADEEILISGLPTRGYGFAKKVRKFAEEKNLPLAKAYERFSNDHEYESLTKINR